MFTSVTLYPINSFFLLFLSAFIAACTRLLAVMNESTKAQQADQIILNPECITSIYGNRVEEKVKKKKKIKIFIFKAMWRF